MSERNININCDLHLKSSSRLFTSQLLSASVHMSFSAHFVNSCFPAPSVNCAQPIYVWGYKMPAGMVADLADTMANTKTEDPQMQDNKSCSALKKDTKFSGSKIAMREMHQSKPELIWQLFTAEAVTSTPENSWLFALTVFLSQTPEISLPSLFDMGCESLNSYNTTIPPVVCLKCRRAGSVPVT